MGDVYKNEEGPKSELDIDPALFRRYALKVVDLLERELRSPSRRPPLPPKVSLDEIRNFIPKLGRDSSLTFDRFIVWIERVLLTYNENIGNPKYFGWIFSPSHPVSALADFIVSTLGLVNNSRMANPVLSEIEGSLIKTIGSLIGFSDQAAGTLVSGGSMANLTALAAAREKATVNLVSTEGLRALDCQITGYVSDQGHFSLDRAFALLGIGSMALRKIPSDSAFKIRVELLEAQIKADLRAGHLPFCIIANGGTTNTGTVDYLMPIADLAQEYNLWFHIDAAYGGFASATSLGSKLFAGIEKADSITINPHKWLFTPVEAGCVLVKDAQHLRAAFGGTAPYIGELQKEADTYELSFQLTRADRALKLYLALALYGTEPFLREIERNIHLATLFARWIEDSPEYELACKPELSIVTFRYRGVSHAEVQQTEKVNGRLNALNRRIEEIVQEENEFLLSSTQMDSRLWLRLCIVNYRTTEIDLQIVFASIQRSAERAVKDLATS